MRKLVLILVAMMGFSTIYAQDIAEPEFIGEAKIVTSDGREVYLPVEHAMTKTRANAALYLFGMGKITSDFYLEGSISSARITDSDDFYILIRAENNQLSPAAYIKIFRFDIKHGSREVEIGSTGSFSGASYNNINYIPFTAKKYGESSYIVKINNIVTGEYGIKFATENNIISTFGVSGSVEKINEYVSYMIENNIRVENYDMDTLYDVPSKEYIPKSAMVQIYGKEFVSQLKTLYQEQRDKELEEEIKQIREERAKKKAERKAKKQNKNN